MASARPRLLLPAILAVALVLLLAAVAPLRAVEPKEMLANPILEARARTLSKELRCMVCQNQSIDDFDAPLAHDLRVLVRERLKAGDSNAQVLDFLVARYGEFVLLKNRPCPGTPRRSGACRPRSSSSASPPSSSCCAAAAPPRSPKPPTSPPPKKPASLISCAKKAFPDRPVCRHQRNDNAAPNGCGANLCSALCPVHIGRDCRGR